MTDRTIEKLFAAGRSLALDTLRRSAASSDAATRAFALWTNLRRIASGDGDDDFLPLFFDQSAFVLLADALVETRYADRAALVRRLRGTSLFDPLVLSSSCKSVRRSFRKKFDEQTLDADSFFERADPFGSLYQRFFSSRERLRLGEFYTPSVMADDLFERAVKNWDRDAFFDLNTDQKNRSFFRSAGIPMTLDPSCGSGVFLLTTLRFWKKHSIDEKTILRRLTGFDLNPISIYIGRLNLAVELLKNRRLTSEDLPKGAAPIWLFDSLRGVPVPDLSETPRSPCRFDLIVGNPPWIQWDRLPVEYRRRTDELWRRYGLFNLDGRSARLGGGKKELAGLFLLAAADHFLKSGGILAMVLPLSLLQSVRAGEGFRRLRSGTPEELGIVEIGNWSKARPFSGVSAPVGTLLLQQGIRSHFPVPVTVWTKSGDTWRAQSKNLRATPADEKRLESPLRFFDPAEKKTAAPRERKSGTAFRSDYTARLGVNTAGANGLFWFRRPKNFSVRAAHCVTLENLPECGKRPIPNLRVPLESERVFSLLRWRDVEMYRAEPSALILMTQDGQTRRGIDENTMRRDFPLTLRYLTEFRSTLESRAAWRKLQKNNPFWSIYNVCAESFAPIKVVWRRMDSMLRAAVIPPDDDRRPVLPQETLSWIAVDSLDEGDYLAARINSEESQKTAASLTPAGTKSFGSPGLFPTLGIERFDPSHSEHRRIAALGRKRRLANSSACGALSHDCSERQES